jgi:hypothetical protein
MSEESVYVHYLRMKQKFRGNIEMKKNKFHVFGSHGCHLPVKEILFLSSEISVLILQL